VQTPDGPGDVLAVNVLRQALTVRLATSGMEAEYTHAQIQEATSSVSGVAHERARSGVAPTSRYGTSDLGDTDDSTASELLSLLDDPLGNEGDEGGARPQQREKSRSRRKSGRKQAASGEQGQPPTARSEQAGEAGQERKKSRRRKRKPAGEQAGQPPTGQAAPAQEQHEPDQAPGSEAGEGEAKKPRRRRRRRSRKPDEGGPGEGSPPAQADSD
jgi:hypothetical protein